MKTTSTIFPLAAISCILFLILGSCSKDRIEPERDTMNEYGSMQNFYDMHKQKEQEFVITGDSGGPIIGNQGTKIWLSKHIFMYQNGADVEYPFTVKLIELYKPKDMLLYNLPTVTAGNLLSSDGELRIRAFKGADELVLKYGKAYYTEAPSPAPLASTQIYFGKTTGSITDWVIPASQVSSSPGVDTVGKITPNTSFYAVNVPVMGWINLSHLYTYSSAKTKLKLTSTTDNLTNVSKFLYLKDIKSLVQIHDSVSTDLPVGLNVTVICAGMTADNKLYSFTQNATIVSNHTVDVVMTQTTDNDFLNFLSGL